MKTYEFNDEATGEDFFVEAETQEEAMEKAKIYFIKPTCFGEIPRDRAEAIGYDTY